MVYLIVDILVSALVCTNNGVCIRLWVIKYNHSYGTTLWVESSDKEISWCWGHRGGRASAQVGFSVHVATALPIMPA